MKRRMILAAMVIASLITGPSAFAGQATDALTVCMTDNTTGKERKDMARWIFVGMSAHPAIQNLANVTEKERDQVDRDLASIVTRLLTESCKAEAKLALQKEANEDPLKTAFGVMGKVAMQELTNDAKVQTYLTSFAKYLDDEKFKAFDAGQ